MSNQKIVTCCKCANFIEPDPQFEKNSIGLCLVMERWLDKFVKRSPAPAAYDKNFQALGGKIWMPFIERYCGRFQAI